MQKLPQQAHETTSRALLHGAFQAALQAADPSYAIPKVLKQLFPQGIRGRCIVIGAGKASASMADALEKYALTHWPQAILSGLVITRYGHDVQRPLPDRKILVCEAAHPVPDEAGLQATKNLLHIVQALQKDDQLLVLISGGGSSLLTLPVAEISMTDLTSLTQELLRSGAPIEAMNIVRKHISAIQGGNLGRLAVRAGAKVDALIISDVTGDQPGDIASGPCAVDDSTFQDALNILDRYQIGPGVVPASILDYLKKGTMGQAPETLKRDEPESLMVRNHVIATSMQSLLAAQKYCLEHGAQVHILGDQITGEAAQVARDQLEIVRGYVEQNKNKDFADRPGNVRRQVFISGGETTVTIPQGVVGRGGRCSEFLLALYAHSKDLAGLSALAADTDGIDGSEENAGAYFDQEIIHHANTLQLDEKTYLDAHDAYGFFLEVGGLVHTGPTLTNINDFRILMLESHG